MAETNEKISFGNFSVLELLVLKCIIVFFILHGIDILPQNVFDSYNLIHKIATTHCISIQFPMFQRKLEAIKSFLKIIQKQLELLKTLYLK